MDKMIMHINVLSPSVEDKVFRQLDAAKVVLDHEQIISCGKLWRGVLMRKCMCLCTIMHNKQHTEKCIVGRDLLVIELQWKASISFFTQRYNLHSLSLSLVFLTLLTLQC